MGENADPCSPSHSGRGTYMARLENDHPGYLRDMFCYSERVGGALATWQEIAESTNQKSAAPGESRPTLLLSRKQVALWFCKGGGKEVSAIEKPLLTKEHKQQRVQWAKKWYDLLSNPQALVAFLDEKWFYTTNKRQCVKILPAAGAEQGNVQVYQPP